MPSLDSNIPSGLISFLPSAIPSQFPTRSVSPESMRLSRDDNSSNVNTATSALPSLNLPFVVPSMTSAVRTAVQTHAPAPASPTMGPASIPRLNSSDMPTFPTAVEAKRPRSSSNGITILFNMFRRCVTDCRFESISSNRSTITVTETSARKVSQTCCPIRYAMELTTPLWKLTHRPHSGTCRALPTHTALWFFVGSQHCTWHICICWCWWWWWRWRCCWWFAWWVCYETIWFSVWTDSMTKDDWNFCIYWTRYASNY